jgi:hypothetical protein
MNQVVVRFLSITIGLLMLSGTGFAQQTSENPVAKCPVIPPCECPAAQKCPEAPTCESLPALTKQCAPTCVPKLCDGSSGTLSFDVNADCRITEADATLVVQYLNSGRSRRVDSTNKWYDTNGDGNINPLDALVVSDELSTFCQPTPTPTFTETPTPLPTATPIPPQYTCTMHVDRRGPGANSIYGNGARHDRLYHVNNIAVTINEVKAGVSKVLVSGTIWVDPCNRWAGDLAGCRALEGSTTGSIGYSAGSIPTWTRPDGQVIQLLKAPLHTAVIVGRNTVRANFTVPASDFCTITFAEQVSPLAIDLSGGGVTFTDASVAPVHFDFGEETFATAWVANPESVAFVAHDGNDNGAIDDIHELFGDRTTIGQKGGFRDGFAALAEYDSDKDGAITERDPIFKELLLWSDFNKNGKSDEGELAIASGVVKSLSVNADNSVHFEDAAHSKARGKSAVTRIDGSTVSMYDLWFAVGPAMPVGELPAGKKLSLPQIGTKEYARVRQDLAALLKEDGWKEADAIYESGEARVVDPSAQGVQYTVVRWGLINAPECFAQLRYRESWVLVDGTVACGLRKTQ